MVMNLRTVLCLASLLFTSALWAETAYDPLRTGTARRQQTEELVTVDSSRQREIPLLVYLPRTKEAAPVVLFSHGLGGTRHGSVFLGEHWSGRGYVAVFIQHPGSDDSVWKDTSLVQRFVELKKAASLQNYKLRVADVSAALDQLEKWNREDGHPLDGRLDLSLVGMSGHSFGAVTTQAVSGQSLRAGDRRYVDERIKAAVMFSPSLPKFGDPTTAFGSVEIPWMLMTGTKDETPITSHTAESRTQVYPNLPDTIAKYLLVLHNAEHSAFSDRALPGDGERRNPNHHRAILALSTAFWDAHLRNDPAAREWLNGDGVKSVLEDLDRWESHPD